MTGKSPFRVQAYSGYGNAIGIIGSFPSTALLMSFFPAGVKLTDGATFATAGRDTTNDHGGATFRYNEADTTSRDNGGTVRVDAAGRRWHACELRGYVSVQIFGAVADGVTDCSAAIVAANSWINPEGRSGCLLPPGRYAIAQDIVLPNRLQGAGGILIIGAGRTVTLNVAPDGPLKQLFGGGGLIKVEAVSAVDIPNGSVP
jgi:hypothetical protein